MKRRTRIRRSTKKRAAERREYSERRRAYLAEHWLDQVKIAACGFDEAKVLARAVGLNPGNCGGIFYQGQLIRIATEIHHRNKTDHERLNDERWWISASTESHNMIEGNKGWARAEGFLFPIQADRDGRWGAGNQALTTPEFMASKIRH